MFAATLIGACLGLQAAPPADDLAATIAAWQPTARESRWRKLGWADDLRTARRLSAESGRPVFLFTLDGRMGLGRC